MLSEAFEGFLLFVFLVITKWSLYVCRTSKQPNCIVLQITYYDIQFVFEYSNIYRANIDVKTPPG